jgi:hypothetical protein
LHNKKPVDAIQIHRLFGCIQGEVRQMNRPGNALAGNLLGKKGAMEGLGDRAVAKANSCFLWRLPASGAVYRWRSQRRREVLPGKGHRHFLIGRFFSFKNIHAGSARGAFKSP